MLAISRELPRLLYLGDVPVEASYHGSALLYRLLQTYPADRLAIIEAAFLESKPERRLEGVLYHRKLMPFSRLAATRFAPWYTIGGLLAASARKGAFEEISERFRPEAILTVTNGFSWISACALAKQRRIPLHLICHDEWVRFAWGASIHNWKDHTFGVHYRAAASRLCVSPFMAKDYDQRYGAAGSVLYPSRAADAKRYAGPPNRIDVESVPFTCVFAGTISSTSTVAALNLLAKCLNKVEGRLVIFGPLDKARALGFGTGNIELAGFVPPAELPDALRENADALFVPVSFEPEERVNAEVSFPSKLADYTAVGLPLLLYGPAYCSAVQWANVNAGVAEVVTEKDCVALSGAVKRLAQNATHRRTLAEKALEVGDRYFSHAEAFEVFDTALRSYVQPLTGCV